MPDDPTRKDFQSKFDHMENFKGSQRELPPPRLLVPVTLLLALKAQIEADAVELESTTRWCRDLPKLIDQGGMPVAWEQLTALLKAHGHEA